MKKKCIHKNIIVTKKETWNHPKGFKEYGLGFLTRENITTFFCEDCGENVEEK